ncbi:MAG: hypothetical protein RL238_529 [Actinomycetota bacterium]|jgi:hypothetical protein
MTDTPDIPTSGPHSALDQVMQFFELVFSGAPTDPPTREAEIEAMITAALSSGYTYNGQPGKAADLVKFRAWLLSTYPTMVFRVQSAITAPIGVSSTTAPTTGVAISWRVDGTDKAGKQWYLEGMNLVSVVNGQATTNNQLGDAGHGWKAVGT